MLHIQKPNYRTGIALWLVIFAGVSLAVINTLSSDALTNTYEDNFDKLLEDCNIHSFYEDTDCAREWLAERGDLFCEDEICCGGNSIGWYTCF